MAEEKKKSRHERLYAKKPHLERDETGNMSVKEGDSGDHEGKPSENEKEADKIQSDNTMKLTERHASERTALKHKHLGEHMSAHTSQEVEHAGHTGDKSEMHKRHHEKMKSLHKEHESEHASMHSRHEKEMNAGEAKDMGDVENKKGEKKEEKSGK